jgi:hypothetical protein
MSKVKQDYTKTTWLDWEYNLVILAKQLNQNKKPTNKQKRLIKLAKI